MLSEKKTNCCTLTRQGRHTWKMSPDYLVCCVPPNIGGSEKSWLWVGIGGSERNQLWCVAMEMSGKQLYSKCSKWPPSAWIHASSVFRHWSTASSTMLCWKLAHDATRQFCNSSVSWIAIRYMCCSSMPQTQYRVPFCDTDELWKHAVTLLAWHSSCHTSQLVLFRAINANSQPALFRATNVWRNATYLMKVSILQGSVVTFFHVWWIRGNSFSSEIT